MRQSGEAMAEVGGPPAPRGHASGRQLAPPHYPASGRMGATDGRMRLRLRTAGWGTVVPYPAQRRCERRLRAWRRSRH